MEQLTVTLETAKKLKELQRQKDYYWKNRESILAKHKQRRTEHASEHYAVKAAYYRRRRLEAIEAYGGKCVCCSEAHPEFLAFDHVDGGGREHRRTVGTEQIIYWAKQNGWPKILQLLCHNCNAAKEIYGLCPHKEEYGKISSQSRNLQAA